MRRTKAETWKVLVSAADSGLSSMNTHTHTHARGPFYRTVPLSFILSFPVISPPFSSVADAVWNNETKGSSSEVGSLKRVWWGGSKVTLHQSAIFTRCPFNRRSINSSRIFSQFLLHTAVPSQAPASDGTSGFTPHRAAKGNTPRPPAFCTHFSHLCSGRSLPAPRRYSLFNTHMRAQTCITTFNMKKWVLMLLERNTKHVLSVLWFQWICWIWYSNGHLCRNNSPLLLLPGQPIKWTKAYLK